MAPFHAPERNGARVNDVDSDTGIALHYAAELGGAGLGDTLVEAGADVSAKDVGGRMPIHYA